MSRPSPVLTVLQPTAALTAQDWDDIWALTCRFYETERAYVELNLRRHAEVALFWRGGALVGMAAVDVYSLRFEERPRRVIFTSQALLDESVRGHNLLQWLGLRVFLRERLRHPLQRIDWFFDTFSYKSYYLLPRNFAEYWPRHDRATPADIATLMDHLALRRYGRDWQADSGVVRGSGHKRLRSEVAPLSEAALRDPHIHFFASRNPGHAQGDLLVCLCPLHLANWLSLARHALRRAWRFAPATSR